MGNYESSKFQITYDIEQICQITKEWMELCLTKKYSPDKKLVDVSLNDDAYQNPLQHKYILKFNVELPPTDAKMYLFFPNHSDPKYQKLLVYGSYYRISEEINNRLAKSVPKFLVIACSKWFFRFFNINGNVYLLSASTINIQQMENIEKNIQKNVPFLVETNGKKSVQNLFIFTDNETDEPKQYPLTIKSTILSYEPALNPYCCDVDPRIRIVPIVKTISDTHAEQIVHQTIQNNIKRVKNEDLPWSTTTDDEEILVLSARLPNFNYGEDSSNPDEGEKK